MDATYTGTLAEGISTTMFDATRGYDKNGNIGYLKRTKGGGATLMDELIYSYTANQLTAVADGGDATKGFKDKVNATDYSYDQAGNMITDANKDLSIAYNHLNLPASITRNSSLSGAEVNGVIKHYYAGATKVRMETYDAAGTTLVKAYDYLAGMVYQETVTEGTSTKELDFVASPEGRALLTHKILGTPAPLPGAGGADKFRFEYSLKDHLGNLRVSCRCGEPKRDAQGIIIPEGTAGAGIEPVAVVQEQHYDPWGLAFSSTQAPPSGAGGADRFTYNSKELLTDLDLGWNDYGARMYTSEIGRWNGVDNRSESYFEFSNYNYVINNPIINIDPNGEYVYLFYYLNNNHHKGEKDPNADKMFWMSALTRATDMLKNGEIKEGDVVSIKGIDDMNKLEETVEGDIAKYSEQFGETKEFGLWSHSGLDGPFRQNSDGSNDQLNLTEWSKINFNWTKADAKCGIYGCRSGKDPDENEKRKNDGKEQSSFAQNLSMTSNMINVKVWGQTQRSWPSPYVDTRVANSNIRNNIHTYPTYMVGSITGITGFNTVYLRQPTYAYPMAVFVNGRFLNTQHQPGRNY